MARNDKPGNSLGPAPDQDEAQWLVDPNRPGAVFENIPAAPIEPEPEPEPLGSPRQEAQEAEPIDPAQSRLEQAFSQYEQELDPELEAALSTQGWSLAGLFRKTGLTSLVLGLTCLALLILAVQALSFASYLSRLPVWAEIGGYASGGLLVILVLIFLLRFLGAYFRLERSPRISLRALRELSARSQLRRQAAGLLNQAKERLVRFLEEYPVESDADKARLARLGFPPAVLELLAENRRQLLKSAPEESCEGWLNQFEARFVVLLDRAARRRVTRYSWLVGVKTAAAPTGFVDTSIVLINAYRLMDDLCQIYRLRAGGVGTLSILVRIFVNAFAAARMEEWMDSATQHIMDAGSQGGEGMAAFFKVIGGGVLSRAAEGGANAFLLVRLGAAGIHYFRPLAEKPGR